MSDNLERLRQVTATLPALQRSVEVEMLLRSMISRFTIGVLGVDSDGVIAEFDSGCEKIFGYSSDEMKGRSVSRLSLHPEGEEAHQKLVMEAIKQAAEEGPDYVPSAVMGRNRRVGGRHRNGEALNLYVVLTRANLADCLRVFAIIVDIGESG